MGRSAAGTLPLPRLCRWRCHHPHGYQRVPCLRGHLGLATQPKGAGWEMVGNGRKLSRFLRNSLSLRISRPLTPEWGSAASHRACPGGVAPYRSPPPLQRFVQSPVVGSINGVPLHTCPRGHRWEGADGRPARRVRPPPGTSSLTIPLWPLGNSEATLTPASPDVSITEAILGCQSCWLKHTSADRMVLQLPLALPSEAKPEPGEVF